MKTHRVLNRCSKWANIRCRKIQLLLCFPINSQSKLKKFSSLFLRYLPRRTCYEMVGSCLAFELEIPEGFTRGFFVKNYYLNLDLFQVL